jgi:hypothetical protein
VHLTAGKFGRSEENATDRCDTERDEVLRRMLKMPPKENKDLVKKDKDSQKQPSTKKPGN